MAVDSITAVEDPIESSTAAQILAASSLKASGEWMHIRALDGLRGAAVIGVLVFHAGYLQGGFLGVDLFFALSGFLITSLLIRDASVDRLNLVRFWGRRFRRLLPAVLGLIAIVVLWSWTAGSAADLDGVLADGPWAVLYLANWHFIADSGGYFDSFAQPSMFDHLWSLAIEEQFYVVWPLVVAAVWKWSARPQRTLSIVSVGGVLASFIALVAWSGDGDPTRVYMGTDTRASSVLVGACIATAPGRRFVGAVVQWLGDRLDVAVAVLCAAILWSWVAVNGANTINLYSGGLLAHSIGCALLIGLVATTAGRRTDRVLGCRPLAWVGTISYSLYLWHWPVYVVLSPDRIGLDGIGLAVLRIVVSVLFAVASLRVVENPVRYRATWAKGRSGAFALVAAPLALLVVLVVIPSPEPEIAAFDPGSVEVVTAPIVSVDAGPSDESALTPAEPDTESSRSVDPADNSAPNTATAPAPVPTPATVALPLGSIDSVLWMGDSIAYDLAPGVAAAFEAAGVEIESSGAYPGLRLVGDDVTAFGNHVDDLLATSGANTIVLQLSSWDSTIDDDRLGVALAAFEAQVAQKIDHLIFVSIPPSYKVDFNTEYTRLDNAAKDFADADPDDKVRYLDASLVWGEPGVLDMNGDGTPERKRDGLHVCPSGAARFGAWLVSTLDAVYDGLTPGDVGEWAAGPWVFEARYDEPSGTCAPIG